MSKMIGLAAGFTATAAIAAGDAFAAEEMRCSHQLPPAHHIAQVIDRWAAEVETLSGGRDRCSRVWR